MASRVGFVRTGSDLVSSGFAVFVACRSTTVEELSSSGVAEGFVGEKDRHGGGVCFRYRTIGGLLSSLQFASRTASGGCESELPGGGGGESVVGCGLGLSKR